MKPLFFFLIIFFPAGMMSQPAVKQEMRAVWIATVENIDWPSSDSLSVEQQQKELRELLDLVVAYHLNTVVFQIRPAADAFYQSTLEPWSSWLTGIQGKAPQPLYDPLAFAIAECHKRGLYIHAWLNPYRAIKDTGKYKPCSTHITQTHPDWFLPYGQTLYFNPGLKETRDYVAHIVSDVVRRYDIDAIHMDDYFYPYRIPKVDFPDAQTFAEYSRGFPSNGLEDWRRDNVDLIIHQIHDSIRAIKPWIEFGISPFGVWRNADRDSSGSATMAGQTNYDDLYADILKWQKEKWIDYVTPQLYWQIGKKVADYAVLASWWSLHSYGCPVYIGQAPYRIDKKAKEKAWHSSREIIRQVKLNRSVANLSGSMFFSARTLRHNPNRLKQRLLKSCYPYAAIPPVNPLIQPLRPDPPHGALLSVTGHQISLNWISGNNSRNFIVYKFRKGETIQLDDASKIYRITACSGISFRQGWNTNPKRYIYVVTALSPSHQESGPVILEPTPGKSEN